MYNKTPSLACNVEISPSVALKKAIAASVAGDTVVVFGSFFTVGPVLSWLESLD
jgi:folylpolyglutamate synthase/dihydropteroate synthase